MNVLGWVFQLFGFILFGIGGQVLYVFVYGVWDDVEIEFFGLVWFDEIIVVQVFLWGVFQLFFD